MAKKIPPRVKPLLKKLWRWLPFLTALAVLISFAYTQPETAKQLLNQFRARLFGIELQVSPQPDPKTLLNRLRTENNLSPFESNPALDQVARLLAVAAASDTNQEEFNIREAASIAGYSYQSIAFFSLVYSLPAITPPEEALLSETNREEILKPEYSQIGAATVSLPNTSDTYYMVVVIAQPASRSRTAPQPTRPAYYTGVELWEQIQRYRVEHGVGEFIQDNVLCTIASIRVNQLIELGRLDNHEGFEPLVTEYQESGRLPHGNVAENILWGYLTPQEAVAGWDGSLGHQALMRDGSYVWGCAAANAGYAVLVAAY
jgi:uncharacterized protein YkwD